MDLSLDHHGDYLFVRRVAERSITVVDRELTASFLLSPQRAVEQWPVTQAQALTVDHVEAVLELKPEVVLLGTGTRQQFPPAAFMAGFLRKGIGIEVMDNAAAARTYDLLASEGRRVVAAFILPAA
ncbi:Mth938-like domain-containing protein [Dyella sp.]|uniref:Mth938-like domain-containing protein n=1 Tax=Dyella sp. TaxID=1869338 RepID=UPI002B474322|nr:Mth938-like domain-containing protein [Dyella sp.]HKT26721.1 Mth938-like domain-containing protein [Dyella sp.]